MNYSTKALIAFVALFLWGCRQGGLYQSAEQVFADQSNATGLYMNGRQTLIYDATIHQTARRGSSSFRIQTDDQSVYLSLQLERVPSRQDPTVLCTISARGVEGLKEDVYQVNWVEGRDGKIWLWNQEHKIGLIIPDF